MSMRRRSSARQFQLMVDFMELHPKLIFGKLDSNFTVKDRQRLWDELTNLLNSDELGSRRDAEKWRKCWHDLKNSIKQKLASLSKSYQNLDNNSLVYLRLTPLEERVMRMITFVTNEDDTSMALDQTEKSNEGTRLDRKDGRNILERLTNIPFVDQLHISLQASAVQCTNRKETEENPNITNGVEPSQLTAAILPSLEPSLNTAPPNTIGSSVVGSSTMNTTEVCLKVPPHQQKMNTTKKKLKKHSLLKFLKINNRRKIISLERIAAAEERKAAAAEKKAEAMKEIAAALSGYLNKLTT